MTPIDTSELSNPAETSSDAFLGGRLVVAQPLRGSRAGMDAVFLAAACPAARRESVLELGSGSGIVALSIARRVADLTVTGIEIDPGLRELSEYNAAQNDLSDRVRFVCGDVTEPLARVHEAGLASDSFDHVVANPPFLSAGQARAPGNDRIRQAHMLEPGDLDKWVKCLAAFAKPGGTATVVHRADALPQLLHAFERRFGGLTVYPLFPRAGEPASRILVHGRKGSRAPLRLAQGMVLHDQGRAFLPQAQAILRHGAGLDVTAAS